MLVGHLHLAAHSRRLAVVNTVGVAVLHIHLGAVAFAIGNKKRYTRVLGFSYKAFAAITHRFSRITPLVSRTINACSQNCTASGSTVSCKCKPSIIKCFRLRLQQASLH